MDFSSSSSCYYQEDEKYWVGFCPSNINRLHMSSCSHSSDQLCIFNNSAGGGVINGGEEDGRSATDLSIFTCGSPPLEDFLGCCADSGSSAAAATEVSQFGDERQTNLYDQHYLYDSDDHKTINAAIFLPDFSAQQIQTPKLLTVVLPPVKKAVDSYGHRTSIYRGVTRHRWTGRYEAHLWDNTCRREGQSRKGRQVYLGGYDREEKAARAYDLAALKYWGPTTTTTNFPVCNYVKELEDMKNMTRQEFVAALRRKSSGFSRGASIYRGVTRHHQQGRWQARIGRVAGNKDLYLGTFSTQEEAAEAYDIAAIKFRGLNAVTNFDMSRYDVKSIASSNLPVGGKSWKTSPDDQSAGNSHNKSTDGGSGSDGRDLSMSSSSITFALQPVKQDPSEYWPMLGYNQQNSCSSSSTQNPGYNTSSGLFQGTTQFSVEFSTLIETNNNNVGLLCGGGGGGNHIQQQQTSSIPFTTPIALNSHDKSNYYGGGGYGNFGNWIAAPSLQHSFQTAKAD